jgi:hypothetical protein
MVMSDNEYLTLLSGITSFCKMGGLTCRTWSAKEGRHFVVAKDEKILLRVTHDDELTAAKDCLEKLSLLLTPVSAMHEC